MTTNELDEVIKQLRDGGMNDEMIIRAFASMYLDDKLNYEQLDAMVNYLGYHLDAKMEKMSDKKRKAFLAKGLGRN